MISLSFLFLVCLNSDSFAQTTNKSKVEDMYLNIKNKFPSVPEIKISEYKSLSPQDLVLVDVRDSEEIKISTLPGAISLREYEQNQLNFLDKKIVVYCTIGYRSAEYVKKLIRKGRLAYNLEGSLLGWIHNGGSVVDPSGTPTRKVHVYGRKWNYLPTGYTGIW